MPKVVEGAVRVCANPRRYAGYNRYSTPITSLLALFRASA
jgi:hypothetical protein